MLLGCARFITNSVNSLMFIWAHMPKWIQIKLYIRLYLIWQRKLFEWNNVYKCQLKLHFIRFNSNPKYNLMLILIKVFFVFVARFNVISEYGKCVRYCCYFSTIWRIFLCVIVIICYMYLILLCFIPTLSEIL